MDKRIRVAALQLTLGDDWKKNVAKVTDAIREAASKGARIILPSELFEGFYFCRTEDDRHFQRAHEVNSHPFLHHFSDLAKELEVVLPISFFERSGPAYYNSLALFDADGSQVGIYRKSHIPDGPGYEEKFYFRPGDTGIRVWKTRYARLGIGICWDQWFPEVARILTMKGAELLLYPTAIGSEPGDPTLDTRHRWRRAMQGHAASNVIPVVAANRVGMEEGQQFYGHSFCSDESGALVEELLEQEGICYGEYDFSRIERARAAWGFFRDRRPDLYGALVTGDGVVGFPRS
jgi:N-carbamoylputrescine amidase